MKILDCFTFYNELDLLTYRLNLLNDIVDYFIIVEANQTHSGKTKQLFFDSNKDLYKKFDNKIIHIIEDLPYKSDNVAITNDDVWKNENAQRNFIFDAIRSIDGLSESDIIIISDLDEITDPKILYRIKDGYLKVEINALEMDLYYYNLNTYIGKWCHPKIMSHKKYIELKTDLNAVRLSAFPIIKNAGWHLSYFGDEKFIQNKIINFAHQEYNVPQIIDLTNIKDRVKNCKDIYSRDEVIVRIEIKDNFNLPPEYDVYLTKYYN